MMGSRVSSACWMPPIRSSDSSILQYSSPVTNTPFVKHPLFFGHAHFLMLGFLFRSSDTSSDAPSLSIIGDDTNIQGETITGSGDLRIEGKVHADIIREGRVVVAPDGEVHGTVQAQSIYVAGVARGELCADETLVLGSDSDVHARLQADALTIESGADFRGIVYDPGGGALQAEDADAHPGDHLPSVSVSSLPNVDPAVEDDLLSPDLEEA